jgi:hypothetical protein
VFSPHRLHLQRSYFEPNTNVIFPHTAQGPQRFKVSRFLPELHNWACCPLQSCAEFVKLTCGCHHSRQAIKKYIQSNNSLGGTTDAQFNSHINRALTAGEESGVFERPKGPSGPVKLKKPASAAAKPAATKATTTKAASTKVFLMQRVVTNLTNNAIEGYHDQGKEARR